MSKQKLRTQIVNFAALQLRVAALRRRDPEIKAALGPVLKALWDGERDLVSDISPAVFEDLLVRFPNFSDVISYWKTVAFVAGKTGKAFRPNPILLLGDPGIGKTFFASEAAKAIGTGFAMIPMSTMTAGFVIAGSNSQWRGGEPGLIAKTLANGRTANPMLMLDEVDKAVDSNFDPIGPLYPLLEGHTAKAFRDEALEIEVDASNIVWLASANALDNVPAPIQSRFRVVEIRNPTPEQMPAVINSILSSVLDEDGLTDLVDKALADDVIEVLATLAPREIRKQLRDGLLKAIADDRRVLEIKDLAVEGMQQRQRIGFL